MGLGHPSWPGPGPQVRRARGPALFVPGRVILLIQLVQVDGDLIPQRDELPVTLLLLGTQLLAALVDGLIHRREVVEDEELLEVRHQLHQGLAGSDLRPWGSSGMVRGCLPPCA